MSEEKAKTIITLDGPAGSGKSTAAKAIAKILGYAFMDTGAMYRSATWWAMNQKVDLDSRDEMVRSTQSLPLNMEYADDELVVKINDHEVTHEIRTPEVTNNIKKLDAIPEVRQHMVKLQREFAARRPTVADGRDMGTVVFPNARHKFFIDASLEERTKRRAKELTKNEIPFNIDTLRDEIHTRDENDRNRDISPLLPASDATIIDTTGMTIDEVIQEILRKINDAS